MARGTAPVIEAKALVKHYPITRGVLFRRVLGLVRAVDGIGFAVQAGETFAVVGESGCGKTTTARLVLGLETPTAGSIRQAGAEGDGRARRGTVQAVFQDPYSSLNPRLRVGRIVAEGLAGERGLEPGEAKARVAAALDEVGLGREALSRYPHMFSGGQRQRIAIARAVVARPHLVVLDEPVSALDVSIRAQILNLLKDLQERLGMAYLMISHDLATVRFVARSLAVMYLGRFVETGPAERVLAAPRHPYTRTLIEATRAGRRQAAGPVDLGEVPSAAKLPDGCAFHPRCPHASDLCRRQRPELRILAGREVACHHAEAVA